MGRPPKNAAGPPLKKPGNGNAKPPGNGNGNGNGKPPGKPDTKPEIPSKEKPKTRKGRAGQAVDSLKKFLDKPRRPNRRAIEAHLKNIEKFTDKEVAESLVDMYDELVGLGVLRARRS